MSTFHGLEMAKRALFTQQSAIHTTGHNISNANTKGYSRQRVNFETTTPYPVPGRNQPQIPGQIGTGVQAGSVERIRTQYLDEQYRSENSKSSYWHTTSDALERMESLMNEPSKNGLAHTMNQFWDALQVLANNPENEGARSVVARRGEAVADTFNYISNTLRSIRSDIDYQIDVTVQNANSLIDRIHKINEQIQEIEPHGYLANDLYDERDRLIDELSSIVNIEVSYRKSASSSKDIADGIVTIELVDDHGSPFEPTVKLVDGTAGAMTVEHLTYSKGEPSTVSVGDIQLPYSENNGSLNALVHAYGFEENGELKGLYPGMLAEMDKLANVFITEFNAIHRNGFDITGNPGQAFFTGTNAGDIAVRDAILTNPDLIAAASEANLVGDGSNASNLSDLLDQPINSALGQSTSINGFYRALIGQMGVKAEKANAMSANTDISKTQIENQRLSVSSVSLDEEIANLIKFQHAYNAAARNMTVVDELIDRIINGMGIVGR
ncbi:MAG TPA: flagellar hook-associated protein FlgK [Cerasibacillus sp.]|uniref:flagellar hook-associated protein FlgK n=1 Tax=Cerasibacillus sp. TaxID=2498711 RepID=UPI002F419168